jgi:transposase
MAFRGTLQTFQMALSSILRTRSMSKQAYKFRLYPTRKQIHTLTWTVDRCRELYNAALQERRDAYRMVGKSINYYDQANQLPDIKDIREEYKDIHSQVLQDVLRKADKAFQAFYARCKHAATPGFPRFKGRNQFDSFTYPQGGYSLTHDHRVCLSKIGSIKVKLHRELHGTIKTCTIKHEGECWYVMFVCEVEHECLEVCDAAVGIDLGLLHFATLSDGSTIENPRYYRKTHRKVANQRKDFLHKVSHSLVNSYGLIVFEELQPANMSKRPKSKQDENGRYLPNGAAARGG